MTAPPVALAAGPMSDAEIEATVRALAQQIAHTPAFVHDSAIGAFASSNDWTWDEDFLMRTVTPAVYRALRAPRLRDALAVRTPSRLAPGADSDDCAPVLREQILALLRPQRCLDLETPSVRLDAQFHTALAPFRAKGLASTAALAAVDVLVDRWRTPQLALPAAPTAAGVRADITRTIAELRAIERALLDSGMLS